MEERSMEIVEIECPNCGKKLYIDEKYIRNEMFCTPKCMDSFTIKRFSINNKIQEVKLADLSSNLIRPEGDLAK